MPTEKKPIVKRAPKTLKEKAWARKVLEGKSATKAAAESYDTTHPGSAMRIGHENAMKLNITDLLAKRERLSLDALLERMEHGLYNSKKLVSARLIIEKGRQKDITADQVGEMLEANGNTNDFIEVDDNATMHKFLETGLKAHGVILNRNEHTGKDGAPLMNDKVRFSLEITNPEEPTE